MLGSRALANQTRAAESINITTSKIRAGARLARRYRANTLNTAWLSLTNYVPAAANDRKQRLDCDLIFLRQLRLELWDKSKFHAMERGSLETELKRSLIALIMKGRNVQQLLYVGQDANFRHCRSKSKWVSSWGGKTKMHNPRNNQTSSRGGLSYWPLTKTTFIWLRSTNVIFALLRKPLSPITQTTSPLGPALVDSWLLTESELQAKHNHSEQSEKPSSRRHEKSLSKLTHQTAAGGRVLTRNVRMEVLTSAQEIKKVEDVSVNKENKLTISTLRAPKL